MDHEGSVAKVFQKMSNIIEENDGTRSFEWVTDTCHDQQAPFQYNQETRIALTSSQHLISDSGTVHPPAPQCFSCKDTYILLTPGDMKFKINGEPDIVPTQRDDRMLPPTH